MNKLIKLLREFDDENWNAVHIENYIYAQDYMIISKRFGFINRLVDNDKIETNNLSLKAFKNIFSCGWFVEVSDLEVLLMLLAISDTPIEDLISYLK